MKRIPALLLLAVLLGSATLFVASTTWTSSDKDYSVKFAGGKVEGTFSGLKSTVVLDAEHPEKSKISASIDATTISTGNGTRDEHAMAEDALNAAKFPVITFESNSVEKKDNIYQASGILTMKGVSKEMTIPFAFAETGSTGKLTGSFIVMPKDFGVTRGGTPEKVTIDLTIPYTK